MCVGVDGDGLRVDVVAHLAGTLLLAFGGAGGLLNRIPLAVIVETGGRQDILPSQITAGVCRTICCLIATLIVRVTIFPTGSVFMARLNAIRVLANIFTMDDFLQFIVLIRVPNLRIVANGSHQIITGHFHAVGCNIIGLVSTGRLFQLQQHIVLNLDCVGIDISFVT